MLIKDNETELYHSGIYLGKDYSNGIKHYKYIRKETKNGKTRYYYDTKELDNARKRYEFDKKHDVEWRDTTGGIHKTSNGGANESIYGNYNDTPANIVEAAKKKYAESMRKHAARYLTQRITDIPKQIISRGAVAFLNLKEKIKDRWRF